MGLKFPPFRYSQQSGQVILFALLFMGIMLVISASLIGYTTLNVRQAKNSYYKKQALYLAEAGVEKAIAQLNLDSNYGGESNTMLGEGEFSVSVVTVSSNLKSITSTAFVPNSINPRAAQTVKVQATVDNGGIAFNFGVQVGRGGLVMDNNSQINGNVFSNGSITGGQGNITGSAIVAAGTSLAADEEWGVQNNNFDFAQASARKDVAQSFVPSETNKLNRIQVYLRKTGTPSDLIVRILSNNNDNPSKTELSSAVIPASLVTGSYGWIEAAFSSPASLSAGTKYWLMLSSSVNAASYYTWGTDSNNGYGNGVGKYSSGWNARTPVWTNVNGDFNYKTFMGGEVTYFEGGIAVGGDLTAQEIRDCGQVAGTAFYGTVFNSCTASSSVSGTAVPGPEAMPVSQAKIEEWKQVAQSGGVISGSRTISGVETLGPVKIDGNLVLDTNAVLYVTGVIWVKGDITFGNNSIVRLDGVLGNAGTVILADNPDNPSGSGIVNVFNNALIEGNGNPGSFPMVLTNSSNLTAAMNIGNNSVSVIYYASNGTINVSNNAGGNQVTGYRIRLNENASITYQGGLQNASFKNGPGGSWSFLPGSYAILP